MRHQNSKAIFTYWNNLRAERAAPDRREIEPSDIRNILGDTFILEMDETYKTISFRLAGTRICASYARELKGLGFLALWEEADNFQIFKTIREVNDNCIPCTISCLAQSSSNRFAEFEIVLLPLNNTESGSKRILGTSSPLIKEDWLGSDPIINNRIKHIRYIDVETANETVRSLKPFGINAPKPDEIAGERKIAHLTVIDGGLV